MRTFLQGEARQDNSKSHIKSCIIKRLLSPDALLSRNSFTTGKVAGLGSSVDLVASEDAPITIPTSVSFTSNCVASGNATIEETVFSIQGEAKATYEDVDCAGLNGIEDVIVA